MHDLRQFYTDDLLKLNTSKRDSLIYKKADFLSNTTILDYYGGRYNDMSVYMRKKYGIEVFIWDPVNRPKIHNRTVEDIITTNGVDYVVCDKVLNLVPEPFMIDIMLKDMWQIHPRLGTYITIYEGNRTGISTQSSRGWQRNDKLDFYMQYICKYFRVEKTSKGYLKLFPIGE